jgi:hypothetical protein
MATEPSSPKERIIVAAASQSTLDALDRSVATSARVRPLAR